MNAPASYPRLVKAMEWILNFALVACALTIAINIGQASILAFTDSPPDWVHLGAELEVDAPPNTVFHTLDGTAVEVEYGRTMATLQLPATLKGAHYARIAFSLILLAIGGYQTLQMRAIVRSLRLAHPFIPANAQRLRRIAGLTLVGFCLYAIFKFIHPFIVAPHFEDIPLNITLNISLNPVLFALALFIIAEVFNIGVKMREEQELTV